MRNTAKMFYNTLRLRPIGYSAGK